MQLTPQSCCRDGGASRRVTQAKRNVVILQPKHRFAILIEARGHGSTDVTVTPDMEFMKGTWWGQWSDARFSLSFSPTARTKHHPQLLLVKRVQASSRIYLAHPRHRCAHDQLCTTVVFCFCSQHIRCHPSIVHLLQATYPLAQTLPSTII